ncbi:MAG: DNA internalization-related competence protein ComEC/Rec2 [Chloroflexi bacterium]|nr:DNA internalization-related competence protein ComEC/Rec2 [Chloroflexota bacterium]
MRLTIVCGGFVVGLFFASDLWPLPWGSALLFVAAAGVALVLLWRWRLVVAPVVLLAAGLLLGLARGPAGTPEGLATLLAYQGQQVGLWGVVVDQPQEAGSLVKFRLSVREVAPAEGERASARGDVLVWAQATGPLMAARPAPYFRYGDRLELRGELREPPTFGDFDYRRYLEQSGVVAVVVSPRAVTLLAEGEGNPFQSWVYTVRQRLATSLDAALPEPHGSLARTLLLGLRGKLPDPIQEQFRVSGTYHMLAISGLHVGVVLGVTMAASAAALGRRRGIYLLPPLGAMWLYTALSGFSPSATRAAIMGSLYLGAYAVGRQPAPLQALALAAALMAGAQPKLLQDLSFQLSFTALGGILLLSPCLQRLARRLAAALARGQQGVYKPLYAVGTAVAVGLGATLGSLPLVAFNFHRIPLWGVPATVLALPVLPAAVALGFLTALLGLLHAWLAAPFALGAWLVESYLLTVVRLFAAVPGGVVSVGAISPALVWGYYGLGAGLLLAASWRAWLPEAWRALGAVTAPPKSKGVRVIVLVGAVVAASLTWSAAMAQPDGRLHLYLLDVGHGDAILLRTPRGYTVLVDGGGDPRVTLPALDSRLPFWDRAVDLAVVSHTHADHLVGLVELARRGRVRLALEPPSSGSEAPEYRQWQAELARRRVSPMEATAGQVLRTSDGLSLRVLNPPEPPLAGTSSDEDNNSVVLLATYGNVSFLLTGDLHREGEFSMLDRGVVPRATVLKVAHHGKATSTGADFLAAVQPTLALVSASAEGLGRPDSGVLADLHSLVGEERLLVTSARGTVHLTTDGKSLRVDTERAVGGAQERAGCATLPFLSHGGGSRCE